MSSPDSGVRPAAGSIALTLSRRLGMVLVLALAFFMSATVTIYSLFRSGDTRVPNVVGKSEGEAQQIAVKAGLNVRIQRRNDDKVPANTVIETRPGPNSSVKKESPLTIVVSSGPSQTQNEAGASSLISRYSPPALDARSVAILAGGSADREIGLQHIAAGSITLRD